MGARRQHADGLRQGCFVIAHLCFHGIGRCRVEREPGEARYWVEESVFLAILDAVAGRPDVELSFDDGNISDAEVALPALLERGLSATFFALAGRLEDASSLNAQDLRDLRAGGMVIGSHGWQHISWRGLGAPDARRELVEARSVLGEACGADVTTAALPLGRYDRVVLRRLRQAGYQTVFTSDRFPANPGSWLQPRYSVTADDTVESVLALAEARWGRGEVRNLAASAVKRLR